MIGLPHYLFVAAGLFCIGLVGIISRRNAIGILIGIELVLNAANINLVAFAKYTESPDTFGSGYVFSVVVIVLAAAEAAVALAIILNLFSRKNDIDVDKLDAMKG